jgi:transposase
VIPYAVQVFVAIEAVDWRSGFDRLAGFARERIGLEPSTSALFVFFGRRRDAVKIVFLNSTGRCRFRCRSSLAPVARS